VAVVGGLLLLVAHPPVGWWPTTFVAPALLLWALTLDVDAARVQGRRVRSGRLGFVFGLAAFGPMLTWLVLPAGYVGWALLAAVQAGWMSLLALVLGRWLDRWWLAPVAAVAWTGIDAWRAIVPMNGFEWGAIPYAHVDGSWLLPIARLVGGRGITLMVVLISALAFQVVRRTIGAIGERDGATFEEALRPTGGLVGALVAALLVSVLATIEPPPERGSLDVLAVQGNDIRHWEEPDPDPPLRITTAMRDLTLEAVADGPEPDLVVWPESSIDRGIYTRRGEDLRPLVEEAVAGVPRLLAGANLDGEDPETEWWNTALVFEGELPHVDAYLKHRLVPFGEYIPFRPLFDWFPPLDQIPRDGQSGPRGETLALDGVEAAVIICFETLFSDVTRDNVMGGGDPAEVLIVITNNASFGDSAQPAQHLAQTRLRAVETGRWAVHGAISGTSAFVDPDGGAHQATTPFSLATIRHELPLVRGHTPFLLIGDVVGVATRAGVAVALLWIAVGRWRRRGGRGTRREAGERGVAQGS
jgi:apolipoprotein N-acyltransferase